MNNRQKTEEQALADRLTSYSDALVALAFIFASGLGLAIADPDIRVTIADAASGLIVVNILLGIIFSVLLFILRQWELNLREEADTSEIYQRYSQHIFIGRHLVIWISVALSVAAMLAMGE